MTLEQLKKTNAQAVEAWIKDNMGGDAERGWASVQPYKGKLYLVWDNGCYLEAFIWTRTAWRDLNKELNVLNDLDCAFPRWYQAAGREYNRYCKLNP